MNHSHGLPQTTDSPSQFGTDKRGSVTDAWMLFFATLLLVCTLGAVAQIESFLPGLAVTELFLILLPTVVYLWGKRLPVAESLRLRIVRFPLLVRSLLLGVLAWGMAAAVAFLVGGVLGPSPTLSEPHPATMKELLLLLIVMSVLPGVCEEALFRGAIQAILERRGVWRGVIYTALLFGVFHLNPWLFLSATGLGLLFGVIVIRTNSIVCAMACHMGTNATAALAIYFQPEDGGRGYYLLLAALSVLFVLGLFEFLRATRGIEYRTSPLTSVSPGKWARAGVAVVVLLVAAGVIAFPFYFRGYRMMTDDLAPEVSRGERVLVLKSRAPGFWLRPGDVVAFRKDGGTRLRRVMRVGADAVWVRQQSSPDTFIEEEVPREAVVGKMVYHFSFRPQERSERGRRLLSGCGSVCVGAGRGGGGNDECGMVNDEWRAEKVPEKRRITHDPFA